MAVLESGNTSQVAKVLSLIMILLKYIGMCRVRFKVPLTNLEIIVVTTKGKGRVAQFVNRNI